MADTVLDAISVVNTESVPRALNAALKLDENIAEIGSRTKSFQRDADLLVEQYNRTLSEQLMTAEMRLDDTERKLQVLMKRLNKDVDERSGQVDESTSHRKNLADSFVEDTNSIDAESDAFTTQIESFENDVQSMSNLIENAVGDYQNMTNDMNEQMNSAFQSYEELHKQATSLIANTLSDGTDTMMQKMGSLESLIEEKISDYKEVYGEVLSFLGDQSGAETEAFDQVLSIADDTLGGVAEVFDGSIGDIADKLEEISGLIDTIKPILDFIDDLV